VVSSARRLGAFQRLQIDSFTLWTGTRELSVQTFRLNAFWPPSDASKWLNKLFNRQSNADWDFLLKELLLWCKKSSLEGARWKKLEAGRSWLKGANVQLCSSWNWNWSQICAPICSESNARSSHWTVLARPTVCGHNARSRQATQTERLARRWQKSPKPKGGRERRTVEQN